MFLFGLWLFVRFVHHFIAGRNPSSSSMINRRGGRTLGTVLREGSDPQERGPGTCDLKSCTIPSRACIR
jgi:hypothetical protein